MKSLFGVALMVACFSAASLQVCAQGPKGSGGSGSGQNQSAAGGQNPAANSAPAQQPPRTSTQTNSNPFPEDTTSVPIIPTHETPDLPPSAGGDAGNFGLPMPPDDADPMRSPEDAAAAAESSDGSSSSSLSGYAICRSPMTPRNPENTNGEMSKWCRSTMRPRLRTRASAATISRIRIGKAHCRGFNLRWFWIQTIRMCTGAWQNANATWVTLPMRAPII